jgi:hypothetical protein
MGFKKTGAPTGGTGGNGGLSSGPTAQVCRQLLIVCTNPECEVKLRGARGIGKDGKATGIRRLMPHPASEFKCACGARFWPQKPEQVWPEVYFLMAFLALAGVLRSDG